MKICVVCHEDVSGKKAVRVREDRIIHFIRAVKGLLHVAAGNELYVCENDVPKHIERRRAFEKSMLFYGILSSVVVLLLLGTIIMSGRFSFAIVLSALLVGVFILAFALIFKYAPGLESTSPQPVAGSPAPAAREEGRKPPARKAKAAAK